MARRARRTEPAKRRRLNATFAAPADASLVVPVRWVKFIVGIFLLAPCYILTAAFFRALMDAFTAQPQGRPSFWMTPEFWFFSLGLLCWLIVYFGLPRWVTLYVYGHELTHAIMVRIMGGKVDDFDFGSDGGHIISSKINTWIALAPYFIPIYSVFAIVIYGLLAVFTDLGPHQELATGILAFTLGFTWCFHACFTITMIPKGQSDLHYGGTFFSLVVIYLMNLLVLSLLLIVATPHVSFASFGRELLIQGAAFANYMMHLADLAVRALF